LVTLLAVCSSRLSEPFFRPQRSWDFPLQSFVPCKEPLPLSKPWCSLALGANGILCFIRKPWTPELCSPCRAGSLGCCYTRSKARSSPGVPSLRLSSPPAVCPPFEVLSSFVLLVRLPRTRAPCLAPWSLTAGGSVGLFTKPTNPYDVCGLINFPDRSASWRVRAYSFHREDTCLLLNRLSLPLHSPKVPTERQSG
jgi:hypothetical protein